MQIPQQPPEDEQRQASQPLYEFVSDSPLPAPQKGEEQENVTPAPPPPSEEAEQHPGNIHAPQATTTDPNWPPPSAEDIRQGLVYPPPPSFYQDRDYQNGEQEPGQALPLPSQAAETPGTASLPPPFALPASMGTEQLPAPPFMPMPPPRLAPPVRKSRKWMWIVIAMLAGVLVLSCGLCTWAGYILVAPTIQDETSALSLANNYYDAIQARNYTAAYSYLTPQGNISGLTRAQFIQQAESRDSSYGPVHSYTPGQPSITSNAGGSPGNLNLTHLTITVNVTRTQLKYSVVLSLEKINGSWKIVDFDRI